MRPVVKEIAVLVDYFSSEAVKCMDRYFKSVFTDDLTQTLAHGIGATFGKRQAEDVLR
ncbi:hypothetical protein D3C87_2023700 [compost metagenome]